MTKNEYTRAVRKANRIFGYIQIANSKRPTRLSKAKALNLVNHVPDDAEINAEWATEEQTVLLVG
jgi:predicted RNA-binding protein associated with RNAse of E/G family